MNMNRGIFEGFSGQPGEKTESPFKPSTEPASAAAASPFKPVPQVPSPFAMLDDATAKPGEPGRPVKLPERRKPESPFQVAEPSEGFGFEATGAPAASPFTPAASEFSATAPAARKPVDSPFAIEGLPATPAPSPFPQWGQPAQPPAQNSPLGQHASPFGVASHQASYPSGLLADSSSIRQLELRAIFGVDRELGADEILHRARSLSGVRGIARLAPTEAAAIDVLKNLAPQLGSAGPLKLFVGNTPVEFIREGAVTLAVKTDHGFGPGVRETLMIVARELGRLP